MTDVAEINDKKEDLSLVGKIASIVSGPITGMLPPRVQVKIANGSLKAAEYMSTSSRATNILIAAYAVVSTVGKMAGIDIDPTSGDFVRLGSAIVGVDTVIREGLYALHYNAKHPNVTYHEAFGEPIISMIDVNKHPEWYK